MTLLLAYKFVGCHLVCVCGGGGGGDVRFAADLGIEGGEGNISSRSC